MTKYLQPLEVEFFQDCKYLVKKIVEYSKTHWSICGDIDFTTREAIMQIPYLACNHFYFSFLGNMRQYAFQEALIENTDLVFRSVKQACFHETHLRKLLNTTLHCLSLVLETRVFKEFYKEKHFHD